MEACGGAHHWAPHLQAMGYRVQLIAPELAKSYVKDVKSICEAMTRPGMRFVSAKSVAQQDLHPNCPS
jgi:transposase